MLIDTTLILRLRYDLLLTWLVTFLTGVLETGCSLSTAMASMVLSDKQMKGFETLISEDESNNEGEKDGRPQLGQIHVQLLFFSLSYMNEDRPLHLL